VGGVSNVSGGFDSHALPPCFIIGIRKQGFGIREIKDNDKEGTDFQRHSADRGDSSG
jgi:hypothetical protein